MLAKDAVQRQEYLAAKRRELQRLLADDTSIEFPLVLPSSTGARVSAARHSGPAPTTSAARAQVTNGRDAAQTAGEQRPSARAEASAAASRSDTGVRKRAMSGQQRISPMAAQTHTHARGSDAVAPRVADDTSSAAHGLAAAAPLRPPSPLLASPSSAQHDASLSLSPMDADEARAASEQQRGRTEGGSPARTGRHVMNADDADAGRGVDRSAILRSSASVSFVITPDKDKQGASAAKDASMLNMSREEHAGAQRLDVSAAASEQLAPTRLEARLEQAAAAVAAHAAASPPRSAPAIDPRGSMTEDQRQRADAESGHASPTRLMEDIHARLMSELDRDAADDAHATHLATPPRHSSNRGSVGDRAPPLHIPDPPDSPNPYESVRAQVLSMSVELEERTRQNAILRTQLKRARQLMDDKLNEIQSASKMALERQRVEAEAAAAKQLSFIDKLLADKKALAEQVEALTQQLAMTNAGVDTRIREVVESAKRELLAAKDAWAAQEKARRVAWQQAQLREMRERTIKSVEPDIQRMIEANKAEIAKVEAACQEQIRAATAYFESQRDAMARALREEAVSATADGTERERTALRHREAALREEHDRELSSLRAKYVRELDDERHRAADASRADLARHMEEMAKLQHEWQGRLDDVVRRQSTVREDAERRVSEALAAQQRQLEEERQQLERTFTARIQKEWETRETELRAELQRSKEEHSRALLAQLSGDAQAHARQIRADADAQLARVRQEHAAALEALHADITKLHGQLAETKSAAARSAQEHAGIVREWEDRVQQLEAELEAQSARISQQDAAMEQALQAQERQRADADRQKREAAVAYEAAITDLTRQLKAAAVERSNSEAKAAADAAAAKKAKAEELAEVEARVKAALKKRDDMIAALRAQVVEERAKADAAHRMMVNQRRDMLGESVDLESSTADAPVERRAP